MRLRLIPSLLAITACGQVADPTPEPEPGTGTAARAALVFPPADCVTEGNAITIRGTAVDPDGIAAVRVNGMPALSSDGFATWEARVPLVPGPNELAIDVEDERGNLERGAAAVRITVSPNPMAQPTAVAVDPSLFSTQPYFVADARLRAVFSVDPTTGARTLVSGEGRGAGPALLFEGIAFDGSRARLITSGNGGIMAVDLATGDRTAILSEVLFLPVGLALDGGRALVVVVDVFGGPALLQSVNLSTGARTTISGGAAGTGPAFGSPTAIAFDPFGNRVLVADGGLDALIAVNLGSGARTVLSGAGVGAGPALASPSSIALPRGLSAPTQAWITDTTLDAVIRVDLATGDRTVLSAAGTGTGDAIGNANAVAYTQSGELLLLDGAASTLFKVNAMTGNRTTLTSSRAGSGPPHPSMTGLALDGDRMLISDFQGIFRLDLAGSARTRLAEAMGDVSLPAGPVIESAGTALVSVAGGKLLRVELDDGMLSVASGGDLGTGPALPLLAKLALGPAGRVLVAGSTSILAVDLASGDRTTVSGGSTGTGPALGGVTGVSFDPAASRVLAIDAMLDALLAIDTETGNRIALSSAGTGSGPVFVDPTALDADAAAGRALVVDSKLDAVISVSLANGNRTVISDASTPGPRLATPQFIDADFARGLAYVADQALGVFAIDLATGHRVIVSH